MESLAVIPINVIVSSNFGFIEVPIPVAKNLFVFITGKERFNIRLVIGRLDAANLKSNA
jgi:hypothetical protein